MSTPRPRYRRRVTTALAVVLSLAIGLVRWWPADSGEPETELFREKASNRIQIQEIQPTSQSQEKTPPPPAPVPPVVVPDEVLIKEDLEFGEAELRVDAPEDDQRLQEGSDHVAAARQPRTEARLLKNVQPNYPQAARNDEVHARIKVEVHIGKDGSVEDATIKERRRLFSDGTSRPVADLGYGLEEAAIAAAERSLFRPAQNQGSPVATRKVVTFTFGPNQSPD